MEECAGCGAVTRSPWGYCYGCTAALLDLSRAPEHRLSSPEALEHQFAKIRAHNPSLSSDLTTPSPGGRV